MISSKSNLNALSKKSILTFIKFRNNFAIVVESFYHATFCVRSTKTVNTRDSVGLVLRLRRLQNSRLEVDGQTSGVVEPGQVVVGVGLLLLLPEDPGELLDREDLALVGDGVD